MFGPKYGPCFLIFLFYLDVTAYSLYSMEFRHEDADYRITRTVVAFFNLSRQDEYMSSILERSDGLHLLIIKLNLSGEPISLIVLLFADFTSRDIIQESVVSRVGPCWRFPDEHVVFKVKAPVLVLRGRH